MRKCIAFASLLALGGLSAGCEFNGLASGSFFVPPSLQAAQLMTSFVIPQPGGAALSHTPCVVFTRDGDSLLAATSGGGIAVFDAESQRLARHLRAPSGVTDGVSVDASGRIAVWILKNDGISVVDLESGALVARDAKRFGKCVAVRPDGEILALAGEKDVELLETGTLNLLRRWSAHAGGVTHLEWSPDGKRVASTGEDGRLVIYEVDAGGKPLVIESSSPLYAASFHPSGKKIAYGGKDRQIRQYEFVSQGKEVLSGSQPFYITCLGYSPDGEFLAVGDESCDIWLYRMKDGKLSFHHKHHEECWLNSIAWSPDSSTFVFGCRPNSLAGKPAVVSTLTLAEAARTDDVRRLRERLLEGVRARLEERSDADEQRALKGYAEALAQNGIVPAPVRLLPPDLAALARKYEEAYQSEVKRLRAGFCINRWEVKPEMR